MSERTFFTLRYALPGYTFILMSILVAYPELQLVLPQIEDATLVGAFLAFLYLLSGGAIGFLVSQPYYVIYNLFIAGRYGGLTEMREFLRKKYHLTDDIGRQIIFFNYIKSLSDKEFQIYAQRRWDLMHICGSTFVATIIGLIFGFLIRVDVFRINFTLKEVFESVSRISMDLSKISMYDFWIILIIVFLLGLLFAGAYHAGKQEARAIRVSVRKVVNSGKFPDWKARKIFSDDYFSNNERS